MWEWWDLLRGLSSRTSRTTIRRKFCSCGAQIQVVQVDIFITSEVFQQKRAGDLEINPLISIVWNPRRGRVASIQCTVDGLWLRGPNTGVTSVEMIWTSPRGVLWCCFFQMCHRCLGPWSQKIWMWNGHWLQGSSISLCPVTRSFYHHLTCSDILWPPTPISLFCYVQHAHIYPTLTPHLSAAVLNAFSAVDAPKRFARAANFSSSVREIDASRCEWTTRYYQYYHHGCFTAGAWHAGWFRGAPSCLTYWAPNVKFTKGLASPRPSINWRQLADEMQSILSISRNMLDVICCISSSPTQFTWLSPYHVASWLGLFPASRGSAGGSVGRSPQSAANGAPQSSGTGTPQSANSDVSTGAHGFGSGTTGSRRGAALKLYSRQRRRP